MDNLYFSKIIKKERKERKMTQEDLSVNSGVSLSTIRAIEQGTTSVNVNTLDKILILLNLELTITKRGTNK